MKPNGTLLGFYSHDLNQLLPLQESLHANDDVKSSFCVSQLQMRIRFLGVSTTVGDVVVAHGVADLGLLT